MRSLPRLVEPRLHRALKQFRVVGVVGARQVGKSTLVHGLQGLEPRHFVTLDDLTALAAARADPRGFVAALPLPATIDEIQRVPELLLAIKEVVDRARRPGSFLLTGSSRLDLVRGLRESLAGRMALLTLRPLTVFERRGATQPHLLEQLFACPDAKAAARSFAGVRGARKISDADVLGGGYPEPTLNLAPAEREFWFQEYRKTYVERDVPAIVRIDDVPTFARFFLGCAATTAQILNTSNLARDAGVSVDTARRWIGLLEATFIAERRMPLWRELRTRIAKSPKLYLCDSGLAASTIGIRDLPPAQQGPVRGHLLETWVHHHLSVLSELAEPACDLQFFRSHGRSEVDFVLVRSGRMIGIEVKWGATVRPEDASGIEFLAEHFREFRFGIVAYGGDAVVPLSAHSVAVPLAVLFAS